MRFAILNDENKIISVIIVNKESDVKGFPNYNKMKPLDHPAADRGWQLSGKKWVAPKVEK